MKIQLIRYNSQRDYTNGLLFVNKKFECHTLEDEYRSTKVWGETRIPSGTYNVELRNIGGKNEKYKRKFPEIHHGMLWIKDVPGFEYILIHIGNTDQDTAGCVLVGSSADKDRGFIGASTKAYRDFYPEVSNHILNGGKVQIEIKDLFKNEEC